MRDSYVYFIKPVGMDGPIKIGYSTRPSDRLMTLAPWSPFPLEVMGTFPGSSREENFLHGRFAAQHSHREWFHSSPLLRRTIERLLQGVPLKEACEEIPKSGTIRNQKRRIVPHERQRFYDYGKRIRNRDARDENGWWMPPQDVHQIMEDWRGDYALNKPVEPTPEQIARLEEYLADPRTHGVYHENHAVRVARLKAERDLAEAKSGVLQ